MEKFIVLLCLLHVCSGVIYRLNSSEHARMPTKYAGDSFEKCHWDPDAIYCFGEYTLFSDTPSPLLHMIQEYSAHNTTHFNYTSIRRGICVTQTCKNFNRSTELDLRKTLEACLNETIYNQYQLQTRLTDRYFCNQPPKDMPKDALDIVVGVICGLIVLANLIGSFYEPYSEGKTDIGSRFILCFSMRKNWRILVAPAGAGQDPRIKRLRSLQGIRTISIAFVIMAHSILACVAYIANPEYVEQLYHFEALKIVFSGMIIMQTFLVMSGFLLIYHSLIHAEKHKMTWAMLPKYIILRWLRLTPPYALVLALTVTWLRFATDGPLWKELIGNEIDDCKQYWWQNLLYINNYNDQSQCLQHTWYLAADTQLYWLGVVVYLACTTPRSRKVVLSLLLVAGIIIPGAHTYFQNLDGSLVASPEAVHNIFMNEPTFNNTYRRGHTNIAGYAIGLALGYILYHIQKKGIDTSKYRKYRYLCPILVPISLLIIYAGSMFYTERPRHSIYVRVAYASLVKSVFGGIIAFAAFLFITKMEDLCRRLMEWRGWTTPSRLSYCAYLVHVTFIRNYVALQTTATHTSFILMTQAFIGFILASFITALPLFVMVEAPVGNMIKEFLLNKRAATQQPEDKIDESKQNNVKEHYSTTLSDDEKQGIEKHIGLNNLREVLSDGLRNGHNSHVHL